MKLNGFVLAGGNSTRFGSNKALACIDNKSFIERSIELLEPFCDKIAISGYKQEYASLGYQIISDDFEHIGPLGGLYSCLKCSDTEDNLFLTCDMPFLTTDTINTLINHISESSVNIYSENQILCHPFPGIYSKALVPVIEELIDNNIYKLKSLFSLTSVKYISISDSKLMQFRNINYNNQLNHTNT
ncbi:MAG: molybdenum cofactor guanylyltransferase [Bacteroidales bacterium]